MTRQPLLPGIAAAMALGVSAHASPFTIHNQLPIEILDVPTSSLDLSRHGVDLDRPRTTDPEPVRLHTDVPDLPRAGSGSADPEWFLSPFAPLEKVERKDSKKATPTFRVHEWADQIIFPSSRTSFSTYEGEPLWTTRGGADAQVFDPFFPSLPDAGVTHDGSIGNESTGLDQPFTGLAIPSPASVSLLVFGSLTVLRRRRR